MRMGGIGLKIVALVLIFFGFVSHGGLPWLELQAQLPEVCTVGLPEPAPEKGRFPFPKIQDAIDKADPRNNRCRVIEVNETSQPYDVNLIINAKPGLQLRVLDVGDKVVLRAKNKIEPVIRIINSPGVIIGLDPDQKEERENLRPGALDSQPLGFFITEGEKGIIVQGSADVKVVQNHIKSNSKHGIELVQGSSAVVLANAITNNGSCGIKLDTATIVITNEQKQDKKEYKNRIARNPSEPKSKTFCDVPQDQQGFLRIPEIRIAKDHFSDFLCQTPDGRIVSPCIQHAIEAAENGDTINVVAAKEAYQESLNLNMKPDGSLQVKNLTLQGVQGEEKIPPALEAPVGQSVIKISDWTAEITISDFIIQNGTFGIQVENSLPSATVITVNNVTIQKNKVGIEILGNVLANICDPQLFLCSSRIIHNTSSGIKIKGKKEGDKPLKPKVAINQAVGILENGDGGLVVDGQEGEAEVEIKPFILEVNQNVNGGIILKDSAKVQFTGSGIISISNNVDGVILEYLAQLTTAPEGKMFEGNIFIAGNGNNGIHVKGCAQLTLQRSTILGNIQNGILLEVPSSLPPSCGDKRLIATIKGNTIRNNTLWGVAGFIKGCDLKAQMDKKAFLDKVDVKGGGNDINDNGKGLARRFLPFLREGDPLGRFCPTEWNFLVSP